jgi:O-antigen/teichoic acid export membrane protein
MGLKQKTISGIFWTFSQQFGVQLINFGVSVVLARLLLPEEFGLIGMIAIFITLGNSLMDSGLTSSLIRTKDPDQRDFSTVFLMNIFGSIITYIILFLCAPLIAEFFDQEILILIIRVYCTSFIIRSFSAVQLARLTQQMDFKIQMTITIPSLLGGGLVGLVMAYNGFGVWSLVYMNLVQSLLVSVQLWFRTNWRPALVFDWKRLRYHFSFGYRLTLSGILNTIYDNIYNIVIGKYFSAVQLGYFTRAQSMKQLPVANISTALHKVTYPMFSKIQDNDIQLKSVYRRIMQQVLFWVAPILVISGVLAVPLFRFLLTEKWLPAVPYFQILCLVGIMYPLHAYNLNILKVKGRSDLFLRLEIIKKALITVGIVVAIPFGIYGLLWMQVILSTISFFINTFYSGKFIQYPAMEQLTDILPILGISVLTGFFTYMLDIQISKINHYDLFRLFSGAVLGMSVYFLFAYLGKISALLDFRQIVLKR